MSKTFRLDFSYWLTRVILPSLLVVSTVLVAWFVLHWRLDWFPLAWLVVLYCPLLVLPAFFTYLELDDWAISGQTRRHYRRVKESAFHIPWAEILVADLRANDSRRPCLVLGTAEGVTQVPLDGLDVAAIWPLVQERVSREALQKEAYQRLSAYQGWVDSMGYVPEMVKPFRINETGLILPGLVNVALALVAAFCWNNPSVLHALPVPWGRVFLFGMVQLPWITVLLECANSFEIDVTALTWVVYSAILRIDWEHVRRLQVIRRGMRIMLYRDNKYPLALRGPASWPRPDRRQALELIVAICHHRGIELEFSADSRSSQIS